MTRSNILKGVTSFKREVLQNPIGVPCGYSLSTLAAISGVKEEVVWLRLRALVESGCISMETKPMPNGGTLVTIICLPAAKKRVRRRVSGPLGIQREASV
jgi:hypothetical protein